MIKTKTKTNLRTRDGYSDLPVDVVSKHIIERCYVYCVFKLHHLQPFTLICTRNDTRLQYIHSTTVF